MKISIQSVKGNNTNLSAWIQNRKTGEKINIIYFENIFILDLKTINQKSF